MAILEIFSPTDQTCTLHLYQFFVFDEVIDIGLDLRSWPHSTQCVRNGKVSGGVDQEGHAIKGVRGSHSPHVFADSESVSIDDILAGIA